MTESHIHSIPTTTKTPIISTNKPLPNVTKRKQNKKRERKHPPTSPKKQLYNNLNILDLPPVPAIDPLWQPVAIINNEYAMGSKIGSGSFGSVHAGLNVKDNYRYLAIKLEPIKPNHHPQLEREYKIYNAIHNNCKSNKQSVMGIPKIFYFGRVEGHPFNALIMDMLGPSLEKLFNLCSRKFSLKTVLMIADQMLSRLEFIHDNGYLHRDLKPDNFLMGMYNSERVVYVVDLGLGKSYINKTKGGTYKHIPYTEGKTLTGTARYASVNTHLGVEQSRRDDLESLGYIFMYFLRGRLPWQGIKAKSRHEKYEKIARKKLSTLPENLCKGYPEEFAHLIRYSWRLGYEERPNYEQLRRMFREVFFKLGFTADWEYDWDIKGMGATKLALKNHPFVTGNNSIEIATKKYSKKRPKYVKCDDDFKEDWGGDKHYEHKKQKQKHKNQKHNIINAHIERDVSNVNYSSCLPVNTQHTPKPPININYQPMHPTQQQQQQTSKRRQSSKFWDFSCLGNIGSINRHSRNVNTQPQPKPPQSGPMPPQVQQQRRQSMNIPNIRNNKKKHHKLNRHNSANQQSLSNRVRNKHGHGHVHNNISPSPSPYYGHQPIPKHSGYYQQYYGHQSPVYQSHSPIHIRHSHQSHHSNNYTPSYSYQSSSPSPIHSQRRYSDNYAIKPIITSTHINQPTPVTQSMNGYVINPPMNQNNNLRLQRSKSQRLQGRRSVVLNTTNHSHGNDRKKSANEIYEEWKQRHANDNLFLNSISYDNTYPYPMNVNMNSVNNTPTPTHSPLIQRQYNNYYVVRNPAHGHVRVPQQQVQPQQQGYGYDNEMSISIRRNDNMNVNNLDNIRDISPIPINNEIKMTSTLPLNITPVKKKSIKNTSPRSNSKSNRSNKSNKSHRSSRKNSFHSHSKHDSNKSSNSRKSNPSNRHKLSPKSTKSSSNSPINQQQLSNLKSKIHKKSNPFPTSNNSHASSSMLVNYNDHLIVNYNKNNIKSGSRLSINKQSQHSDNNSEEEGYKMLVKDLTGRSLTNNTLNTLNTITFTKDEKERKNSASTSKILTERDFSSHTETINANRIQMTPTSYISNNNIQHPFIKHCSNSSTQQTVSSEWVNNNNNKKDYNIIIEED